MSPLRHWQEWFWGGCRRYGIGKNWFREVVAASALARTSAGQPMKAGPLTSTALVRPRPPLRTGRRACLIASEVRTGCPCALAGCCSTSRGVASWSLASCGPVTTFARAHSPRESYSVAAGLARAGGRALDVYLSLVVAERRRIWKLAWGSHPFGQFI